MSKSDEYTRLPKELQEYLYTVEPMTEEDEKELGEAISSLMNQIRFQEMVAYKRNSTRLIYLASPYTHEDEAVKQQRFDDVCQIGGVLISKGFHVFSPIVNGVPMANSQNISTTWDYWQDDCKLMIDRCDEVFVAMIDGWDESVGVLAEIDYANETGKPVSYLDPKDYK